MSVLGNDYIEAIATDHRLGADSYNYKINAASVDLAIGNMIKLITFGGYKAKSIVATPNYDPHQQMLVDAADFEPVIRETEVDLNEFPDGIWIRPGVGVLCSTANTIAIPKDVVGQILLKSSRGREFYQSCMAGFFDNGFYGQGTLEIYAPVVPIFFQTGLKIVQMRFDELTESSFDYSAQADAKYQGQIGPTGSKDARF